MFITPMTRHFYLFHFFYTSQITPAAVTVIQDEEEQDFCLEDAVLRSTQGYNDSPWPPGFSINIYARSGEPTGRHVLRLVLLSNQLSD